MIYEKIWQKGERLIDCVSETKLNKIARMSSSSTSSNNMYRVGDFVYVDQGPHVPYGVRRIDELQKSATGNVEMEVMIYLRRMDVNKEVLPVADENLKGNADVMKKIVESFYFWDFRILGWNVQEISHPSSWERTVPC